MKKTTTKVLILMMIIPMLLIFTMGTTIDMTSVMVDVPVTSVDIEGKEVLFVDVTSEDSSVKLNTVVYPLEATNRNVVYTSEKVGSEDLAIVDISKEGVVTPKSTGSVKVIATADGGRQDSVVINFYSSLVNGVNKINDNLSIGVGEKVSVTLGTYFSITPSNASVSVLYTTNSNKIKLDKYTGEITGLFVGDAIVTASIDGVYYNDNSKKFENKTYTLEFNVTVTSNETDSIFSFEGGVNNSEEILSVDSKTVMFSYVGYSDLGKLSYEVNSEDEQYIEDINFQYLDDVSGNINIILKEDAPKKTYIINIKAGDVSLGTLTIKKQDPVVRISTSATTFNISNASVIFGSVVEGIDDGYEIRYKTSDSSVFYVNSNDNECVGKAKQAGTALVTAVLYIDGLEVVRSNAVEITVVDAYNSLTILESAKLFGLERRFVLGKKSYESSNLKDDTYKLTVQASNSNGEVNDIDSSKIEWKSSDSSIATVSNDGVVSVVNDGIVTITVKSVYDNVLGVVTESSFEITCRKNGINVNNYDELMYANDNGYEIVLMSNVMLGDGITASNYKNYLLNTATKQMVTTADRSYYIGNNKEADAVIRYCLEFKNNVYGNGYYIDGDNITRSVDDYNYSVFNGPLNLVALAYDNNSTSNAKVKAQDNIVFLIKKDNISLNNVELKGCSDSSIIEAEKANLGKLNNVGTVVEVVGDNASLNYSRVNNGRTVVRVYGSEYEMDNTKITNNPDDYKVEASISNCILSYAREFILKVGSNQLLRNSSVYGEELALPSEDASKYEHAAPYLKKENGDNYSVNETKDNYFIDNYLMTDIILKDSVFFGAGLFCIGFESQFAGLVLHGYDYGSYKFSNMGWGNVAGTSYPARIKMQGDVRFYDWKEVSSVDSSTLVEGNANILETIGLDLNVANLLNKYNKQNPNNNIIYRYQGNDYVNGAIVFYGGGKNYSFVDTSQVSSDFNSLYSSEIPLSYFGDRVSLIYYAAGKENFKFMTYTSESNLNYENQRNALSDGSAYSWLVRK